jgi:anti-anti-sigma factor
VAAPEESPSASVQALRSAHDPTTILVVISGHIHRSDASRLADRVQELLDAEPAESLVCDVGGVTRADGAVVEALCRIRLVARRHGCRVTLRQPSPELQELLYLTGLTNQLPSSPRPNGQDRRERDC